MWVLIPSVMFCAGDKFAFVCHQRECSIPAVAGFSLL